MADTTFTDGATVIVAAWLNAVNSLTYRTFNQTTYPVRLGVNAAQPSDMVLEVKASNDVDVGYARVGSFTRTVNQSEGDSDVYNSLRVATTIDYTGTLSEVEWNLNAVLNNYSESEAACISATASKYADGVVLAVHANAINRTSYNNYDDATGCTGIEAHARGMGISSPTVNNSLGLWGTARFVAQSASGTYAWPVWAAGTAYSLGDHRVPIGTVFVPDSVYTGFYYVCTTAGTSGGAEPVWPTTIGATVADGTAVWTAYKGSQNGFGVLISNSFGTEQTYGYYRVGLAIQEDLAGVNANTIDTAMWVRTSGSYGLRFNTGAHTQADVSCESNSKFAVRAIGTYTTAAYKLGDDQYISWRGSDAVKTRFVTSTSLFEWALSGTQRVAFEIDATPRLLFNGTQVLQTQGAAVADASGGATVDTEARAAVNALLARCRAHGIIAT